MDLSFSRLPPSADPIAAPRDAAAVLAALSTYRCAVQATERHLLSPADGAFNARVAWLLGSGSPWPAHGSGTGQW